MGLLSYLFGSESKNENNATEARQSGALTQDEVRHFFFIANEPWDNLLYDSLIVIERHGSYRAERTGRNWSVVICNEPIKVTADMDFKVCVHSSGSLITSAGEAFQCHKAWLVSSQDIDKLTNEEKIQYKFPFPPDLVGENIPATTTWDEEELQKLALSFAADRQI